MPGERRIKKIRKNTWQKLPKITDIKRLHGKKITDIRKLFKKKKTGHGHKKAAWKKGSRTLKKQPKKHCRKKVGRDVACSLLGCPMCLGTE